MCRLAREVRAGGVSGRGRPGRCACGARGLSGLAASRPVRTVWGEVVARKVCGDLGGLRRRRGSPCSHWLLRRGGHRGRCLPVPASVPAIGGCPDFLQSCQEIDQTSECPNICLTRRGPRHDHRSRRDDDVETLADRTPRRPPHGSPPTAITQGSVHMRIGLAGVGRIGAFHAETLRDLSDVDEVVVADLDADAARAVADKLERRLRRVAGRAARPGRRRLRHRDRDAGPRAPASASASRPACRPSARSRSPPRSTRRWTSPSSFRTPTRPVHVGFQRRFDRGYQRAQQAVAGGELGFLHSIRAPDARPGAAPRRLHPDERRPLPRLLDPRLRHHPLRHRPRGRLGLRHRRQQGRRLLLRGRRRRHGRRRPDARRRHARLPLGHALQRRRPRRAHGGPRQRGHDRRRLRRLARRHLRRARRRPTRPVRATGRSWSASCRPTAPS